MGSRNGFEVKADRKFKRTTAAATAAFEEEMRQAAREEMLRELLDRGSPSADYGLGQVAAIPRLPFGHPDYDWSRDPVLKGVTQGLLAPLRPTPREYAQHVHIVLWMINRQRPRDMEAAKVHAADYCEDILQGRVPGAPREPLIVMS